MEEAADNSAPEVQEAEPVPAAPLSDLVLDLVSQGDLETLASLDGKGLIIGPAETAAEFAERLRTLCKNLQAMEKSLAESGKYSCGEGADTVTVGAEDRIPQEVFAEVAQQCDSLYGFSIDWVPGFYIDPFFLFGGCAFAFYPDFFAMFIVRRSFKTSPRWFIYRRSELLAHELCHIARIALDSTTFEETFAYQTATSAFRRLLGGLFYRPNDSFIFLGSTLLLLLAQVLRSFLLPALPIAPFWAVPAIAVAWLGLRYLRLRRTLARALRNAGWLFGEHARKVIFRASDSEIRQWADFAAPEDAQAWLVRQDSPRWKVIQERFVIPQRLILHLHGEDAPHTDRSE